MRIGAAPAARTAAQFANDFGFGAGAALETGAGFGAADVFGAGFGAEVVFGGAGFADEVGLVRVVGVGARATVGFRVVVGTTTSGTGARVVVGVVTVVVTGMDGTLIEGSVWAAQPAMSRDNPAMTSAPRSVT